MRMRLVVDPPGWPLSTGGSCSQVVVKTGLTVHKNKAKEKKKDHFGPWRN